MSRSLQWIAAGLLLAFADGVAAHSGSTAYLQVVIAGDHLQLRADYALKDLDDAIGLDANDDGQLTWAEVRAAAPQVTAYLGRRLEAQIGGAPCVLIAAPLPRITTHADGPYAVFDFEGHCPQASGTLEIGDDALFDFDGSHRALLRLQWGDTTAAAVFTPERRRLRFEATASTLHTLLAYGAEGLRHVWSGWDHMLFLAGLFLPAALRRRDGSWQPVPHLREAILDAVRLVTAFTIAHATTLCLSALGLISPPTRLVESLVAFSVFFAGFNNLVPLAGRRRLFALAWTFGLIHGAAIAGALRELGLPTTSRLAALLGFNLGVECAQLALVAAVVPLAFGLRHWRGYTRWVLWPGSAAVTLAGLVWLANRALNLGLTGIG